MDLNHNLLAYLIYIVFMSLIIIHVGLICYRNGIVLMNQLMPSRTSFALQLNKILLAGYYLVNIGYTVYMMSTWNLITTIEDIVSTIATNAAQIILLLGMLHYINMAWIQFFFNKQSTQKL
ncbi:hypothetical protein [Dokdonia sp. Hel_I_53]|uniref:hypothetical protein n=1 Tax=Dokdonia sp. Hel_I_53 TaxID=1566287 RepID=UPI00119B6443|nr:hypothetical protein [Dokdonia sp. Hel_I_53]TVZ53159.1 hypothetical protein OD90_2356 [Dokdonia sp. Hel_I_53]